MLAIYKEWNKLIVLLFVNAQNKTNTHIRWGCFFWEGGGAVNDIWYCQAWWPCLTLQQKLIHSLNIYNFLSTVHHYYFFVSTINCCPPFPPSGPPTLLHPRFLAPQSISIIVYLWLRSLLIPHPHQCHRNRTDWCSSLSPPYFFIGLAD